MCANKMDYLRLFGNICAESSAMAKCNCVSCASCACLCSCRSILVSNEIVW